MTYYTVEPLQTKPYININLQSNNGTPAQAVDLDRPLISPVVEFAFSPSLNQVAIAYDMRAGQVEGLSDPNDVHPQGGIRVFSDDDRYLLFGGTATEQCKLYIGAGPTYVHETTTVLPTAPVFIPHATFFNQNQALATVETDDDTKLRIYVLSGNGFALAQTLTPDGSSITKVRRLSESNLLQVVTSASTVLYAVPAMTPVTVPSGSILDTSEDGSLLLIDPGAGQSVELYEDQAGSWVFAQAIPNSDFTKTYGSIAPDNAVITIHGADASATDKVTRVYGHYGDFVWTEITSHGDTLTGAFTMPAPQYSDDASVMAIQTIGIPAETTFDLFERRQVEASPAGLEYGHNVNNTNAMALSDDGEYIAADQLGLRIYRLSGGVWSISQDLTTIGNFLSLKFTDDGAYLIGVKSAAPRLIVFEKNGSGDYVQMTNAVVQPATASFLAGIVPGEHRFFTFTSGGAPIAYEIVGGVVQEDTSVNFNGFSLGPRAVFSPDGQTYLSSPAISGTGVKGIDLYHFSGTQFVEITTVDVYPPKPVRSVEFSSDGNHFFVLYNDSTSGNESYLYIYKKVALNTYQKVGEELLQGYLSDFLVGNWMSFNGQSNHLVVGGTASSGSTLITFRMDNDTLTQIAAFSSVNTSAVNVVDFSATGSRLAVCGNAGIESFEWVTKPLASTYIRTLTVVGELDTLAPDGELVHYSNPGNVHAYTDDLTPLTGLTFEPDFPASQVSEVQYSGNQVTWSVGGVLQFATIGADGGYSKLENLEGTFISLYRLNGTTLEEKGYIAHEKDVSIEYMKFSKTPVAFTYVAKDAVNGNSRRVYDVFQDRIVLKGVEFSDQMVNSFAAFSPAETYFVATYDKAVLDSDIKLYKFDGNLNYTEVDSALVDFGPVAFSSCEDVIVGHGGAVKPFTAYKRIGDEIQERSYGDDMTWANGVILDIEFGSTCDNLIVLVPDNVIPVNEDVDGEPTEGEGMPVDDMPVDRPDIQPGDDDDFGIGGGGGSGTSPGGTHTPGGEVFPKEYIPYVAINVAYRGQPR
ncbi:hypothetical protein Q669_29485 [Labrenzia sp. C1B10]|uniref:WD40 repeat domain-containing protein n=1 Tax=unclassified Labrenzia TaxID=2648686 RepID=UPI0003B897CE|nr:MULTISPECIES: WD40 repeat domain-containing protein [unclassified Labrenzia]ERP95703.1 hypothetical protein Q669_29485 [Labrenzia sp. C1B10]ERS05769.1 hypothetical protein Q675_29050 [Labrenzia sp. C1B70]